MLVRQDQIRRIGWVIKIVEAQIGQHLLGLKLPGEPGHFRQEQDPLGEPPACGVFPSECPSIAPAEINNTPR
jgi:hypothetical protein